MPQGKASWKIIEERENAIYSARKSQLQTNMLGLKGGTPYVQARLSRFPGESLSDWSGSIRKDGSAITGRKDQSHCIPYLGRIAEKINQHVLGVRPQRDGAAAEILSDITLDGESVNQFMRRLNSIITACRWAWIGLDMAEVPAGSVSQADKETLKLRPYWNLYSPEDVVDWYIDTKGGVRWVLTQGTITIASDPFAPQVTRKVRRLWEAGKVTTYTYGKDGSKIVGELSKALEVSPGVPLSICPFVLVGELSADPHQFDNLESINRTIMDLESANRSNFFHCVFPQPYCPASLLETVKQNWEVNAEAAVAMIFGQGYPILLKEGDPAPGYMMPDAAATGTMRTEIQALVKEMFDVVGLMLQQETRQVSSAEAKAWDYLDLTQVMRERAEMLEDAETKAIGIMRAWDSSVPAWVPKYNRTFDLGSFKDEISAIVQALQVSMPPELSRFFLKKLFERARKIGIGAVDNGEENAIMSAIMNFAPSAFEAMPGAQAPEAGEEEGGAGQQ